MRARDVPARERMLAKLVPQPDGCWHWTGGVIDAHGYGRVGYKGRRSVPLQQAVYDCFIGPIPEGMTVDHTCHNAASGWPGGDSCRHRRCGNPQHLEAVTRAENTRRAKALVQACPQGHGYSPENTRVTAGRRFCRTCSRAAGRAYKARRAAA